MAAKQGEYQHFVVFFYWDHLLFHCVDDLVGTKCESILLSSEGCGVGRLQLGT